MTDFLACMLSELGLPTTSIHEDRHLWQILEELTNFRVGAMPILVATAVAARGLDIPGVAHVINYDMTDDVDENVHRMSLSQDLLVVGPLLQEEVVMMTRSGRRWGWDEVFL